MKRRRRRKRERIGDADQDHQYTDERTRPEDTRSMSETMKYIQCECATIILGRKRDQTNTREGSIVTK